MADLAPFPDLEVATKLLIADLGTTGTTTPADLAGSLPFLRVVRFGGGDDRFTDSARIDIDAFEETRPVARLLAETVRQRLLSYPHVVSSDGLTIVIDRVDTLTGPQEVPWGNPGLRRFTASYTLSARR